MHAYLNEVFARPGDGRVRICAVRMELRRRRGAGSRENKHSVHNALLPTPFISYICSATCLASWLAIGLAGFLGRPACCHPAAIPVAGYKEWDAGHDVVPSWLFADRWWRRSNGTTGSVRVCDAAQRIKPIPEFQHTHVHTHTHTVTNKPKP